MAKTRVIIADSDISYIIPLQHKFAEEFYEKIDLELITDKHYFDELFSSPQKVDMLIVSEEFYDPTLHRHSIGSIFLMSEQYEESAPAETGVSRIYKYTSVKEIFNEIIGQTGGNLSIKEESKKAPQILLVCSACGGVGKTTVALGVSACLTRNYKKVLYINAARLQTFQFHMENQAPITGGDVYSALSESRGSIYNDIKHAVRKEIFTYIPPFKAPLISLGLDIGVYEALAISAKGSGDFDYVVIDSDSIFDESLMRLIGIADKVVVVTNQSEAAVQSTNRFATFLNGITDEKYIFVCNDFDKSEDNALIAQSVPLKFAVENYVDHFAHYDRMNCVDLSNDSGMQKTALNLL